MPAHQLLFDRPGGFHPVGVNWLVVGHDDLHLAPAIPRISAYYAEIRLAHAENSGNNILITCGVYSMYLWGKTQWPAPIWDESILATPLAQVSRKQGAPKKDPGGWRSTSYSLLIE